MEIDKQNFRPAPFQVHASVNGRDDLYFERTIRLRPFTMNNPNFQQISYLEDLWSKLSLLPLIALFPSCCMPQFQSESCCTTIQMEMSSVFLCKSNSFPFQ